MKTPEQLNTKTFDITSKVNEFLYEDGISKEESEILISIIKKYGRENIKIDKGSLYSLACEFLTKDLAEGYKKWPNIGSFLEKKITERAFLLSNSKFIRKEFKEKISTAYISKSGVLSGISTETDIFDIIYNNKGIEKIVGDKHIFSFTDNNGDTFNVSFGKLDGEYCYMYKDGDKKGKKVIFKNGFKLGKKVEKSYSNNGFHERGKVEKKSKQKSKIEIKRDIKYLSSNGKLSNVNPINLPTLISMNLDYINDLIGNKAKFSIIDRDGRTFNVVLLSNNGEKKYIYESGEKKGQVVKIYNGDTLGKYNLNLEKKYYAKLDGSDTDLDYWEYIDFIAMIKAETIGEEYLGKVGVAYSILNRMKSGKSMKQVLYSKTGVGKSEFSPVDDGRLDEMRKKICPEYTDIANKVLLGEIANPVGNAIFFQSIPLEKRYNTWQEKAERSGKLRKVCDIGNHRFREIVA